MKYEDVVDYFQQAQNISILNEFCQKFAKPLPVWLPLDSSGQNGMELTLNDHKFICYSAVTRNDAKKACASAAIDFFTKNGNSFFQNFKRNYLSMIYAVCQLVGLPQPQFSYNSANGMSQWSCQIGDLSFDGPNGLSKKEAKEECSQTVFLSLCKLDSVSMPVMTAFRPKPAVIHLADSKKRFIADEAPILSLMDSISVDGGVSYKSVLLELFVKFAYLGKPYYNYRTTPNGFMSQIIMGARVKVSREFPTQKEAAEDASEKMYHDIIELMGKSLKKRRINQPDEYLSDEDGRIPSYTELVSQMCKKHSLIPPEFEFLIGPNEGFYCRSALACIKCPTEWITCVREHKTKGAAKEDLCRDIHIKILEYIQIGHEK